jgi:hypothetical protein
MTLSYYHEPLLLAIAALVIASVCSGKEAWERWAQANGFRVLQVFAHLQPPSQHPLGLALFAELLHHQRAAYRPTSTTTALWSAVVMDYHRGEMEMEEMKRDVWSDVPAFTVALLVAKRG